MESTLDKSSKKCQMIGEVRQMQEGMMKGDFGKPALNAALLALFIIPGSSNAKVFGWLNIN